MSRGNTRNRSCSGLPDHFVNGIDRSGGSAIDRISYPEPFGAQISTEGMLPDISLRPSVYKGMAVLAEPTIDDQRPDDERFEAATGLTIPFGLLPNLRWFYAGQISGRLITSFDFSEWGNRAVFALLFQPTRRIL